MIAVRFYSFFNAKAKQWYIGRLDVFKKLSNSINNEKNIVWFHCASLGEFEQGSTIISSYKKKYPHHKILLTFFSPSGYEICKDYKIADWIFYLPADTNKNAKKFVNIVKPIKVFFIKYEFWFNYMKELKKQNIALYSVSTIFRNDQVFFRHKWFSKQLNSIDHFFVQDENSKKLLNNIGLFNCTVSGDSRFDKVITNTKNKISIPLIEVFSKKKLTIVCGSTWPKDEKIIIQFIKKNPYYQYIIAPHELYHLSKLKKQTNALLFSKANKKNISNYNVIIIDNLGMLSNLYQYGNIAYIGGGFSAGIHNILEPAAFNLPIVFGPNHKKSIEASQLIKLHVAKSVSNFKQLESAIDIFASYNQSIALDYIHANIGSTKKILANI